jgi:hypothetical protein
MKCLRSVAGYCLLDKKRREEKRREEKRREEGIKV